MSFIEQRLFDGLRLIGTAGGPRWSTSVVPMASGREQRNVNWSRQRARYDIGGRLVDADELREIVAHFNAVQGMAMGFRWRDISDHTLSPEESHLEQLSATTYQLHKVYGVGTAKRYRKISKPVADDFALFIDGVQVPAVDFSLDATTGVVALLMDAEELPLPGAVLSASCTFDIPVRFDTDELNYAYQGGAVGDEMYDLASLPVVELKL